MHSTPSTADQPDFDSLLSSLTDDELRTYGEIAADQRQLEYDRWWIEVVLWLAATAVCVWSVWLVTQSGVTRQVLLFFAIALALAYWPWRKTKMRRLWQGHYEAVARERARRGTETE